MDLGFTLQQVQALIDEKVDPGELRARLELRRAGHQPGAQPAVSAAHRAVGEHAAFPITGDVPADPGFQVVDLPAIERAATLLHHGPMSEAFRTGQLIAKWIDDSDYRTVGTGYAREIYLDCPMHDLSKWITEMQVAVAPAT
ncbi:GyrI-like domain-containing protein [Actinoplanes sp. NPDC049118]|uniref:GyrI-like domain-containing protein n=1 Tax=Actinoplanes sp. NPDC049118 TaxID=3155769 RepID=UPI0034019311